MITQFIKTDEIKCIIGNFNWINVNYSSTCRTLKDEKVVNKR